MNFRLNGNRIVTIKMSKNKKHEKEAVVPTTGNIPVMIKEE